MTWSRFLVLDQKLLDRLAAIGCLVLVVGLVLFVVLVHEPQVGIEPTAPIYKIGALPLSDKGNEVVSTPHRHAGIRDWQ